MVKYHLKITLSVLFIFIFSCKENVTEIESPSLSDVKIL